MAQMFRCEVVIPTRQLYKGMVSHVEIPGEMGNFGVLAGHEKIVAKIRPGVATLSVDEDGKDKVRFALYEGVAEMMDDRLIIMGRMGCDIDQIDVADVEAKAEALRVEVRELEELAKAEDEAAAAKLDIAQDRLAWYETQLMVARGR